MSRHPATRSVDIRASSILNIFRFRLPACNVLPRHNWPLSHFSDAPVTDQIFVDLIRFEQKNATQFTKVESRGRGGGKSSFFFGDCPTKSFYNDELTSWR